MSQYSVPATLVEFDAALASSSDGVHEMLVAEASDAIVVSAREPNFARSVCRNALDAERIQLKAKSYVCVNMLKQAVSTGTMAKHLL